MDDLAAAIDFVKARLDGRTVESTRLGLEGLLDALSLDDSLVRAAAENRLEDFLAILAPILQAAMIQIESDSRTFFERFWADHRFREHLMSRISEDYRRRHSVDGRRGVAETSAEQSDLS